MVTHHPLHAATTRLINIFWGGSPLLADEGAEMTRSAGFESVRMSGPPRSFVKGITGRRPR